MPMDILPLPEHDLPRFNNASVSARATSARYSRQPRRGSFDGRCVVARQSLTKADGSKVETWRRSRRRKPFAERVRELFGACSTSRKVARSMCCDRVEMARLSQWARLGAYACSSRPLVGNLGKGVAGPAARDILMRRQLADRVGKGCRGGAAVCSHLS